MAFGDLPAGTALTSSLYEGPIVDGVRHFQSRHGIAADGVLGRATLAALAVPMGWRVRQIELALERLRWLPDLGDERLLAVNIPMFRLWAWDSIPPSGAPSFSTGVIVGRALDTQTPVFVEELRYVIFRPYWNVPASITAERDPAGPRDGITPTCFGRTWRLCPGPGDDARSVPRTTESLDRASPGPAPIRQRPGPERARPREVRVSERSDVYMHGTPAPQLFCKPAPRFQPRLRARRGSRRAGRVGAEGQPEWTRDRILAAMNGIIDSRRPRPTDPHHPLLHHGRGHARGRRRTLRGRHLRSRRAARSRACTRAYQRLTMIDQLRGPTNQEWFPDSMTFVRSNCIEVLENYSPNATR